MAVRYESLDCDTARAAPPPKASRCHGSSSSPRDAPLGPPHAKK